MSVMEKREDLGSVFECSNVRKRQLQRLTERQEEGYDLEYKSISEFERENCHAIQQNAVIWTIRVFLD